MGFLDPIGAWEDALAGVDVFTGVAFPRVAVFFAVPAVVVALFVAIVGVDLVAAGALALSGVFAFAVGVFAVCEVVVTAGLFAPLLATLWIFATPARQS